MTIRAPRAVGEGKRRLGFLRSKGGNVAVIFALSLFPMIGMAGLGIDVARTLSARTTLQGAADAAALAAATEAEATIQAGGDIITAQVAGTLAGQRVFLANTSKVSRWLGAQPQPSVQVNPGTANITAFVSFTTPVPTMFGKTVGVPNFNIAGNAASSLTLPTFLNISVVTDVSQSMGLAATTDGQNQLTALTPNGCAFGCHVPAQEQLNYNPPYQTTFEDLAHNANPKIQLRIDVIRDATKNMINSAKALATSKPFISFGLYTMQGGNNAPDNNNHTANGQPLTTLAAPSTNYDALISANDKLDLGPNNAYGVGDSDFKDAMTSLTSALPSSGDGKQGNPQQFLFLMTDGVQDVPGNCGYGHCTQAFDPSWCNDLKSKQHVTIGVIYTTYLAMPWRAEYRDLVQPFADSLVPNLTSCASPGWFYQASDANDIQVAINALFAKATGHGVLTQ